MRKNGRVAKATGATATRSGGAARASRLDQGCAEAIDVARSGLTGVDPDHVGEHLQVVAEGERVVTHLFESKLPGYRGWRWAVTVARAPRSRHVTVCETALLPGDAALLAPAWVPWRERLRPGDLSVGDVLPSTEDDHRLVPSYLADDDSSDDPAGRVVAEEIGIGRERVLSPQGRIEAAERWRDGDFGPRSAMARHSPGPCATCGFYVPLAGSLRLSLGVCANGYSPADGHVVTADYGCGAHSQATLERTDGEPAEVTL